MEARERRIVEEAARAEARFLTRLLAESSPAGFPDNAPAPADAAVRAETARGCGPASLRQAATAPARAQGAAASGPSVCHAMADTVEGG